MAEVSPIDTGVAEELVVVEELKRTAVIYELHRTLVSAALVWVATRAGASSYRVGVIELSTLMAASTLGFADAVAGCAVLVAVHARHGIFAAERAGLVAVAALTVVVDELVQ